MEQRNGSPGRLLAVVTPRRQASRRSAPAGGVDSSPQGPGAGRRFCDLVSSRTRVVQSLCSFSLYVRGSLSRNRGMGWVDAGFSPVHRARTQVKAPLAVAKIAHKSKIN
jgi:hypothetical protein